MARRFLALTGLALAALLSSCDLLSGFIPPPEVESVIALSALPDDDFATSGRATISILALDLNGDPIINWGLGIEASDTQSRAIKVSGVSAHTTEKLFASPLAMAIDIDSSGSMGSTDPQYLIKTAAKSFVDMLSNLNKKSEMSVLTFGAGYSTPFLKTKLEQDFTTDKTLLHAAIDKASATGQTPLYDSLYEVTDWVDKQKSSLSYSRGILVLSDGGDSGGGKTYKQVSDNALSKKIPINCVALGYDNDRMIQLAALTKGYDEPQNLDTKRGLDTVDRDLPETRKGA